MRVHDEQLSVTYTYNRQLRTDGQGRDADDSRSTRSTCPDSLVVVSNRQPYRHEFTDDEADTITVDEPTGGLTAGLDPVLQAANGTWIAWGDGDADFEVTDDHDCVGVPPDDESYTLRRIDLSDEAVDAYYRGFSNRVLWPLCHGFAELVEERPDDFEWYRTVNARFAEAVADHAEDDSVVWLQDYHFALAPRMIRESIPRSATVAQFWHIPWPSPAAFEYCPAGDDVLEGLLGNDLLGFHVAQYADNFLDCVARYLSSATVDRDRRAIRYGGETTRVVATPMGIDAESYDERARGADADQLLSLFDRYDVPRNTTIGLGVDRLDYTKGIPERLTALERFFEDNPSWQGEFAFVQKATPSRTEIPAYARHGEFVRNEVERINRRFETDDWQPIVYTEDILPAADLCALYRHADVMIVSPLVDGMNLVAQEYVAASTDADGTLLLSDRAGAHEHLDAALTIDPTDSSDFAARIEDALSMTPQEQQRRMNEMRSHVFDADIEAWMDAQFEWLQRIHDGPRSTWSSSDSDTDPDHDPDSREHTPPV